MSDTVPILRWATLSEMLTLEFKDAFAQLEAFHSIFLGLKDRLAPVRYKLPTMPLYEWSRRVEYPFVLQQLSVKQGLRVLDAGSGVTFFPFYLTKMRGAQIECLDREPLFGERIREICDLLAIKPAIPLRIADLTGSLPLAAGSYDAVMCISVLEHLSANRRLSAVEELWRVVAPGGRLILTFDVSITGQEEGIPLFQVRNFARDIERLGVALPALPDFLPNDLLSNQQPGYGLAPILRRKKTVIRSGLRAAIHGYLRRRLGALGSLACILCSIPKPR